MPRVSVSFKQIVKGSAQYTDGWCMWVLHGGSTFEACTQAGNLFFRSILTGCPGQDLVE